MMFDQLTQDMFLFIACIRNHIKYSHSIFGIKYTKHMKKRHKVQTVHHILPDFHKFLQKIEKIDEIQRITPGRIQRKQRGSSQCRLHFAYPTIS